MVKYFNAVFLKEAEKRKFFFMQKQYNHNKFELNFNLIMSLALDSNSEHVAHVEGKQVFKKNQKSDYCRYKQMPYTDQIPYCTSHVRTYF